MQHIENDRIIILSRSRLFVFDHTMNPFGGGVERVSCLLGEEMKRRGHHVAFLSIGHEEEDKGEGIEGIKQYHIPRGTPGFEKKFKALLKELKTGEIILQGTSNDMVSLLEIIPEEIKTYIVLHNQPYPLLGKERHGMSLYPSECLNVRQAFLKYLGMASPAVYRFVKNRREKKRNVYISHKADRYVFLCRQYVDRIIRYTPGINTETLASINNPNTFRVEPGVNLPKKENAVLFVGRMVNSQKNITGFIEVWERFSKTHPDWHAYVAGDGEHAKPVMEFARKRNIRNLHFEGNRKDVEEYYKKSKILCMTSVFEGWPMVLAESMAYGCVPVVYDTFEAVHDLIDSGSNGFIVEPFNAEAMSRAAARIVDDDALRESMIRNGLEKIREFSVERIVDQWEEMLKNLTKNNKKR